MRVQSVRKKFFPQLIQPVRDLAIMRAKQWRDSHYPLVDHFINSNNFFSSVCIDIFRRKLMLITLGTERVKGCICISIPTHVIPPCVALREPLVIPGTLSRTTDCTILVPNQLRRFRSHQVPVLFCSLGQRKLVWERGSDCTVFRAETMCCNM